MQQIPLSKVASQESSFSLDGAFWTIKVYPAINHMVAEISRNGTLLMSGIRCFGGIKLLPYEWMCSGGFGNFYFDEDADWENFGDYGTCNLYYMTADEVATYEATIKEGYASVAYYAGD